MPPLKTPVIPKTRIQTENEQRILDAGLEVFSLYGFRGSTIDQISAICGLSKPNLLYYFKSKQAIYNAVLERTLALWIEPFQALNPDAEPIAELSRYIDSKLDLTFQQPHASRLFANEILHGAPHVAAFLKGPLRDLVAVKAGIIRNWVAAGKLKPVDPEHLVFAIWSVTQHYADFATQVELVLGAKPAPKQVKAAVKNILLQGLKV